LVEKHEWCWISLVDRIYLVVEELNLFRNGHRIIKRCLLITGCRSVLRLAGNTKLRASGIKVELYPDNAKVAKQFQHADKRSIPLQ
jgi:histidyl-tRNA synthetase